MVKPSPNPSAPSSHRRPPGSKTGGGKSRLLALMSVAVLVVGGATVAAVIGDEDDSPAPPDPATTSASSTGSSQESPSEPPRTYRAFSNDSWWNTPLPYQAPDDPAESEILDYMRTGVESGNGCLMLAGAGDSPWGNPIYWAQASDPEYDLQGVRGARPPEVDSLRIPHSAEPASNNDGHMSIYDLDKGYVVALTDAEYDADSDEWSASGASVAYLKSNGLHSDLPESDEPRNVGSHRGNNGATMTVSWDMVQAGSIRHVLKVAVGPEAADRAVFPMVGSDGDYHGSDPGVPPQGIRLRIKPSIELEDLQLGPQAIVIAQALQRYGFYIGDSGGVTALKLENTTAEGRGQLWDVSAFDLCGLPFTPDYWDVIEEGYDPSG